MTKKFSLKGEAIQRFRFLLENDYPFEKAALMAQQKKACTNLILEMGLAMLQETGTNPKIYEAIKANNSSYATEFRKTFYDLIGRHRALDACLESALRKADTLLAFSPSGNPCRPETDLEAGRVVKGLPEVRMAISKANHPVGMINQKEFETLRANLLKRIESINDPAGWPHFLQCTFFEKLGYVLLICADDKTVKWLTQNLPKLELWPNATLCIMREKTFKQSKAFGASFPDSVLDSNKVILGYLQSQNTGIDTTKWKVLSRQLQDDRTTVKLLLLMPAEPDRKTIVAANCELNFKFSKIKFTTPNVNSAKTWGRVAFAATFPDSIGEKSEDIFKYIESQNEGMDTTEWTVTERRRAVLGGKKEIQLVFVVDSCSAEIIRLAKHEINYKFSKVKLEQQSLKKSGEPNYNLGRQNNSNGQGRGTALGKRPFQRVN
ncbi:uncharacterized protein LOC120428984 [Culex pipiens pallens]|uniref:uncharacterized protein LOC120428984 n=1 Tax=Culex pipiens pallens TaxID=42434 RepID=UPI0019548FFD|nr:uncharacterized protein LOC120428984 [Culex pipiens pallens]